MDKPAALLFLLREVIPEDDMTIVFVATRHHAEFLHEVRLLLCPPGRSHTEEERAGRGLAGDGARRSLCLFLWFWCCC